MGLGVSLFLVAVGISFREGQALPGGNLRPG
jgi:hypothetical protein